MTKQPTTQTLQAIEEELERLRKIRNLLAGAPADARVPAPSPKRRLSDDARRRIVEAQKRRWAAQKAGSPMPSR